MNRWGESLTKKYFSDLHEGANWIALHQTTISNQENLSDIDGLGIYPVREHYIVYVPEHNKRIIIVALIRQTRDVPSILQANSFVIRRELKKILPRSLY